MSNLRLAALTGQFVKFFGVGGIATCVDYATFVSLFHIFGLHHIAAALTGYGAGGLVSYTLSRHFVFSTARSHRHAVPRYLLVMAGGFLLTGLAMQILVAYFAIPALLGRIITYGIVLIFNFAAHRFFTFNR